MKPLIFLSCFFVTVSSTLLQEIGECNATTTLYYLNPGDMLFVESPDFPKSITNQHGNDIQCSMTVIRKDRQAKGLRFIFTNGYTSKFKFATSDGIANLPFDSYDSTTDVAFFDAVNKNSFVYSYNAGSGVDKWSAFQGLIYAPPVDEPASNCWMDNMNITLLNNQRSLPLLSLDGPNSKSCSWTISVPEGIDLKITVPAMQGNQLRVYPDGGDFINLREKEVQYMSGKSFKIVYLPDGTGVSGRVGALALVSAIKQANPVVTDVLGKEIELDDNHSVISFFDGNTGYENNHRYTFPIAPKSGYVIALQSNKPFLEYIADRIAVFDRTGSNYPMLDEKYHLLETPKNVILDFRTDKTITGAGFVVTKTFIECTCAPSTLILPCQGSAALPLMNNDNEIFTYCSNMNCDYNIVGNPNCLNSDFKLKVSGNLRQASEDSFIVTVGDNVVVNGTNMNYNIDYEGHINSGQRITVSLKSASVTKPLYDAPFVNVIVGRPEAFTTSTTTTKVFSMGTFSTSMPRSANSSPTIAPLSHHRMNQEINKLLHGQ